VLLWEAQSWGRLIDNSFSLMFTIVVEFNYLVHRGWRTSRICLVTIVADGCL
jgi:hypothetical protein